MAASVQRILPVASGFNSLNSFCTEGGTRYKSRFNCVSRLSYLTIKSSNGASSRWAREPKRNRGRNEIEPIFFSFFASFAIALLASPPVAARQLIHFPFPRCDGEGYRDEMEVERSTSKGFRELLPNYSAMFHTPCIFSLLSRTLLITRFSSRSRSNSLRLGFKI